LFSIHKLYRNRLVGRLPTSLRGLRGLMEIRLWGNLLEGPIPPEYGELENLQVLQLSENRLTGTIPLTLAGCAKLTHLALDGNQLEGPLPLDLFRDLPGLVDVDLKNNERLFGGGSGGGSGGSGGGYEEAEAALAKLLPSTKLHLRPTTSEFYRGDEC
jgi:hypothetical protein